MDKKKSIRKCSRCKEFGHNIRVCPKDMGSEMKSVMDFVEQLYDLEMIWDVIHGYRRKNGERTTIYKVYLDLESYKKSNYDEKFNILNNPNVTLINTKKPIETYD